MATILEALQNANYNLQEGTTQIQAVIGLEQLNNAVSLLDKGYNIDDDVESLIDKYGSLENVPNANEIR